MGADARHCCCYHRATESDSGHHAWYLHALGAVALGCRGGVAAKRSRGVVPILVLGSLCWWRDLESVMNSAFGSERLFPALYNFRFGLEPVVEF